MRRYILLLFLSLFAVVLFAQENQKSDVIRWIDGEKYYIHKVSQGQGLFSIKKIYGVEQKDLLEANPEAFDGLRLGQELKIPFKNSKNTKNRYRMHLIEAGQTIYSISKIYNVTQESIFELNPETKNGYKINQAIKIPNETIAQDTLKSDDSKDQKTYKVRRKDTLYGLSKKFGVTQEALIYKNPIIARDGLKRGQRLIIPAREIIIKEALFVPIDSVKQQNSLSQDLNSPCDSLKQDRFVAMNVILMLPFELDITSFTQELEIPEVDFPKYKNKPFFEYYQSTLLTLKQLKDEGYKLNLYVFNTKKDTNYVKTLLKKSIFEEADLIIGPVYKSTFSNVYHYAKEKNIPIINPILKGQNYGKNSNMVFDIFPDENLIMKGTVDFIKQIDTSQIFVVHSGGIQDLILLEKFNNLYPKYHTNELGENIPNYKELVFPDSREIKFTPFLKSDKHNLIVVLSDEQAFVSNVYIRLSVLPDNMKVQMLGRPKWEKFSNIDIAYIHQLNTVRLQTEFVNYKDTNVIQFVESYRTYFGQEPQKYAFYAHDYVYNFVKYFYHWRHSTCLGQFSTIGYIFNMYLERTDLGWKNTHFYYVRYTPDLEIERVNF